jgi:hypothetical protein
LDIFNFYEKPYGFEVPLLINNEQLVGYFTPLLSAIQIYANESATGGAGEVLFEFFETEGPHARDLIVERLLDKGNSFAILYPKKGLNSNPK